VTSGADRYSLKLSMKELVSLYLLLTENEQALDDIQCALLSRLSSAIYERLSVDEIENVRAFYAAL
jgi:hypothetical protein